MTDKVKFPDGSIREVKPSGLQAFGGGIKGPLKPVFDVPGYEIMEVIGPVRWVAVELPR